MYARVAVIQVKPHSSDAMSERAEAGLLPIFRRHKGFHQYEMIKAGHDTLVSITTWDSEGEAAEAAKAAAAWMKDAVAEDVISIDNHIGQIVFSHRAVHGGEHRD